MTQCHNYCVQIVTILVNFREIEFGEGPAVAESGTSYGQLWQQA